MKFYYLLFAFTLFIGCGTTTTNSDSDADLLIDPYADPPGYAGDPFAGYGPVVSINLPADENENIEIVETSDISGSWSVQVAACASMDAALTLRDTIAANTGHPVFVDQTGRYYKVRVGSFVSSVASDELRAQLRSNGYPDAWSVQR